RRVARRPPICARRQRSAGADLRRVGDRRALELARLEEPLQEHPQPALDRRERVLVAALLWDQVWPRPLLAVVPGVVGEERDLAGPVAEAHRVVEKKSWSSYGPITLSVSAAGRSVPPSFGISSGLISVSNTERNVSLA